MQAVRFVYWTCSCLFLSDFLLLAGVLTSFVWLQGELEHADDMFCDDIFGESPAGGRRVVRCPIPNCSESSIMQIFVSIGYLSIPTMLIIAYIHCAG